MSDDAEHHRQLVESARAGSRGALEELTAGAMPKVYGLALRMLWNPEDARDATQEIMIRVITNLATFRGESAFLTWVYRIAVNYLITFRKTLLEDQGISFSGMAEDLADGVADTAVRRPEDTILLEELRIGCTMAMLSCLDRPHRMAYILGEIYALDHQQGAEVLGIDPAAFRKRVSRARAKIVSFMRAHCGIVHEGNACRCHRRVVTAIQKGRVDPGALRFAREHQATRFAAAAVRKLEEGQRAAALFQAQDSDPPVKLLQWAREALALTDVRPDSRPRM